MVKEVEEVEDVPSLDHWRKFGVISLLACIPYFYIIEKTPWNMLVCFLISWNPFVRLMFPSQYVPARNSVNSWISHPCYARLLATLAEPLVLEAQAAMLGVPFWSSWMGWLTITGECVSWCHILFQSETIGIIEDTFWMLVQVAALSTGEGPLVAKCGSAFFLFYMAVFHQPRQIQRCFNIKFMEGWSGSTRKLVDWDTFTWTMPSLIAQQILYFLYIYMVYANKMPLYRW